MKSFYYYLLGISLLAFEFSGVATSINVHLSSVFKENPSPKKQDKPQSRKQKDKKNSSKVTYLSLLTGKTTTIDASTAVPTISAVNTVAVQGGGSALPGSQLNYSVVIKNEGTDATGVVFTDILNSNLTLVPGSVTATPIVLDDSYSALGNVGITVNGASGLLANDVSPMGLAKTATAVPNGTSTNGKYTIATDGSFTYTPNAGYAGTDNFTYTSNIGSVSSTGTVNITVSAPIWFVNIAAATNGTGTLASPFKDWSDFATSNALSGTVNPAANQTVFVYSGTYSGAATLKTGQKVLGQGATTTLASFAGVTVPTFSNTLPTTSGTNPNLTSSGTTITIPTTSTIILRGFDMGNSTTDIESGASFGTLTTSEMALLGNGRALKLASGALSASFTSISSTSSTAEGIYLSSVSGTLNSSGGTTITNPATHGIFISLASVNSNFGNTAISGVSGAAYVGLFVLGAGSNSAIITFGDLDIDTSSGTTALSYSGQGSLTSTSGTITAINTPGNEGGISIVGVSSAQKATLSMVLDSYTMTGTSGTRVGLNIQNTLGSFTINGTGTTAGSGGTVQTIDERGVQINTATNITLKNMNFNNANTSSSTCATPGVDNSGCNAAIHAKSVTGLTLNNIAITGTSNSMGINLNNVSGFSLLNSAVTNAGSTNATGNETGGIYALNLAGTCAITNSNINGSFGRGFYCYNGILLINPTVNLTVTNCQFKDSFTRSNGADNFIFNGYGTSNNTITIKSSNFSNPKASGLQLNFGNSSVNTIQVGGTNAADGNTITAAASSPGSNGFSLQGVGTSTINYNVYNNNFQSSFNGGLTCNIGAQINCTMQGRVNSNTVTHVDVGNANGISLAAYGSATHKAEVLNNTISGTKNYGIIVESNDNTTAGSTARMDATVKNNTIDMVANSYAHVGVIAVANNAATNGLKTCINVGNNTTNSPVAGLAAGQFDVLSLLTGNQVILQGATVFVPSGGNQSTVITNFWNANNVGVRTGVDEGGGGSIIAGTCLAPSNSASLRIAAPDILAEDNKTSETEQLVAPVSRNEIFQEINELEEFSTENEAKPSTESTNSSAKIATPLSGETITVNGSGSGFSLPAGKSTTIQYSATISASPTECPIPDQGTVSGTNFTSVQTNLVNTSLTVSPIDPVTATSTAICSGGSISLSAVCSMGTVTWYNAASGGTSVATDSPFKPTNITTATSYYASCVLGTCESARKLVASVTINPNPTASPGSNTPVCVGNTLNLTSAIASSYSWTGPNSFTSSDQNPTVSPVTNAADGPYILTVTNASGCTASSTITVVINSTPVPTVPTATPSSRTTVGSVTLSATGCTGGTLTWYNATDNVAVTAPNNQPNFTSQGTFNFYAKCTGTNTCESIKSVNVPVTVTLCTPLASSPGNVSINWTGLLSTDWNTACNWNPAWVPDATNAEVVIDLKTNQPTITGTVPTVKQIYVNANATLTVNSGGTLNSNSTVAPITLQGGNIINDGTINVNGSGSGIGISIGATANITNRGTITTNNLYGISLNSGNLTFTNESTGIYNGDFKANNNILTLTNRGTINYGGGTFALSLGSIGSSVINVGTISVTGGSGISNKIGSSITNNACGKILMTTGSYENGGTTTNNGLIQLPNLYNFTTNTGTFTNNGVLKANTVSSISNNNLVITNTCPIFDLGEESTYFVFGIFTDAGATTPAGNYDEIENKFVAYNSLPSGKQTLYAKVKNENCTFIVPFDFTNVLPTAVSVSNTAICPNESVTLKATCATGIPTWYTSEEEGVSIGTGTSITDSPTSNTIYYVACEATNCVSGLVATSEVKIVIDTKPPTVSKGTIASCFKTVAAAEAAALAATSATDNCTAALTETASTVGTCSAVITITTKDIAGNEASVTYDTRIDNTPPTVAKGTIGSCYPTVAAAEAAALAATSATDNCPGALTEVASTEGTCSAVITITTKDGCGNETAVTYNTKIDNTAPTLSDAPENTAVSCDNVPAIAVLTATDNCGTATVTSTESRKDGKCVNYYELTRTWTATDICGNTSTKTQTITVEDKTAPSLGEAPKDVTVGCESVPAIAVLTATDNCGTATVTSTESRKDGKCINYYELTRTWTATDICGNTSTKTQTIIVEDKTAPTLSAAPENITVSCDKVPEIAVLTATDNCGTALVTSTESRKDGKCTNYYELTRTWTATDICGNTSTKTQTIIVEDKTAPTLSAAPENVTVSCDKVPEIAVLTATDNCGTATVTSTESRKDGKCTNYYELTRTWTATDICGNTSTKTQTITVEDKTAPTLGTAPENITVSCDKVPEIAVLTATDNCGTATVTSTESRKDGKCANYYELTRTWTATDICGNTSTKTQTIIVEDKTAPTLSAAPENVTVSCESVPLIAVLTATDNCGSATVTSTESRVDGVNFDLNYVLTRTWIATDLCGNTATKTQTIKVICNYISVGSTVFLDKNNNGKQDTGEPGIKGASVQLYKVEANNMTLSSPIYKGAKVQSPNNTNALTPLGAPILTGNNGECIFPNLIKGIYVIGVTPNGPESVSSDDISTTLGDNQTDGDDNGVQTIGGGESLSSPIELNVGTEPTDATGNESSPNGGLDNAKDADGDMTIDFGFFVPAKLNNLVFQDLDKDGLQDTGEPGIGGVTVKLYDGEGNLVHTTETDPTGEYIFENLRPGIPYTVRFTVPAGYTVSPSNVGGDDTIDSDGNPAVAGISSTATYTLSSGDNNTTVDLGLFRTAALPLNLISFVGERASTQVNLTWKTANEVDFSHYEVQRSTNAKEFNAIGKVNGTNDKFYTLADTKPIVGNNYYRLKMVDKNGTYTVSKIVKINFEESTEFLTIENPVTNRSINLYTNVENATFNLSTINGTNIGISTIHLGGDKYVVKVKNAAAGVYLINVTGDKSTITKKVILD
jgi:hypothetical protein